MATFAAIATLLGTGPVAAQDMGNAALSLKTSEAIRFGKTEDLRALIEKTPGFATLTHPFFDMPMIDGMLCDAANSKQARVEIVELLLDLGADPNAPCAPTLGEASPKALQQAMHGHLLTLPAFEGADRLYAPPMFPTTRVGADVYFTIADTLLDEMNDPDLNQVLYHQLMSSPDAVKWALDRGADPDAVMADGRSSREQAKAVLAIHERQLAQLRSGSPSPNAVFAGDQP